MQLRPFPCFRVNPGWGRTSIWAAGTGPRLFYMHVCYMYSMHLTKSNLHSRNNLFKVIAYNYVNQICLTSFFAWETLFCTEKAARREAESQWITTKLWNKDLAATMRLIRSNETQKKARNLTNCKYFDALSFISYDHFSTPNSKKKKLKLSQHISSWKICINRSFCDGRNWFESDWSIFVLFVCCLITIRNYFRS